MFKIQEFSERKNYHLEQKVGTSLVIRNKAKPIRKSSERQLIDPIFVRILYKDSHLLQAKKSKELQNNELLKNEGSNHEKIEVHCLAGQYYALYELFFTIKLFFKHPIGKSKSLVSNQISFQHNC